MRISSSILWSPEDLCSAGGNVRLLVSATLVPWAIGVTVDFGCSAPCLADVVLRGLFDDFVAMLVSCSLSSGNIDLQREWRCIHYKRICGGLRADIDKNWVFVANFTGGKRRKPELLTTDTH